MCVCMCDVYVCVSGTALMGVGKGRGKDRASDAATAALTSPLLDTPLSHARGIVFNVVGGADMTLQEVNVAAKVVYQRLDEDANIIFGASVDENMPLGEVRMCEWV